MLTRTRVQVPHYGEASGLGKDLHAKLMQLQVREQLADGSCVWALLVGLAVGWEVGGGSHPLLASPACNNAPTSWHPRSE